MDQNGFALNQLLCLSNFSKKFNQLWKDLGGRREYVSLSTTTLS